MLWILSPTKNMKETKRQPKHLPRFLEDTKNIVGILQQYTKEELMQLMNINEKIAQLNVDRWKNFAYDLQGSCAIERYDGLQFKSMQMETWQEEDYAYVNEHLRILSGLYGVLRPLDSIYPYRLEMQCAFPISNYDTLYAYWGNRLAECLKKELQQHEYPYILDLSSKEYAKSIQPYMKDIEYISVQFKVYKDGALKTQSTAVKMARGAMVDALVKSRAQTKEEVKKLVFAGYAYEASLSSEQCYVYVKA